MKVEINLNDEIGVKITDEGFEYMVKEYNKYTVLYTVDGLKKRQNSDGYYTMQLWNFIETFSDKIHMGFSNPKLFDTNIIIKL